MFFFSQLVLILVTVSSINSKHNPNKASVFIYYEYMLTFIILLSKDSNNDKETINSVAAIQAIFGKLVPRVRLIFLYLSQKKLRSNYELC